MKTNLCTILLPIFFVTCDNKEDDTSVDQKILQLFRKIQLSQMNPISQIVLPMQSKMVCMAL